VDAEVMAKEVAKELRKRGIWAKAGGTGTNVTVCISRPVDFMAFRWHGMFDPDFASMTVIEIADEIQSREAQQAQEWAGDT
jgi:hypothetical protein